MAKATCYVNNDAAGFALIRAIARRTQQHASLEQRGLPMQFSSAEHDGTPEFLLQTTRRMFQADCVLSRCWMLGRV
eukprot:3153418-Amphidinium_carterae.1